MSKIILRQSGNIIAETGNWYFKIPWRFHNWGENLKEQENLKLAKKDNHFGRFVPDHKRLGPVIKIEKLEKISENGLSSLLIPYFKESFKNKENWSVKELQELVAIKDLKLFLSGIEDKKVLGKILEICQTEKMPSSSNHGDFHPENILIDTNENLKFIDWTRYNENSSLYFDLIDYFIFAQKGDEEIWFDYWRTLFQKQPEKLLEIEINEKHLTAYAIWKISEELKTLYQRKMLNKHKIKKYKKFLKIISELC